MIGLTADAEEAVIARVISSLTSLASLGLLPKVRLWDVVLAVRGFLCHPNSWIRQGWPYYALFNEAKIFRYRWFDRRRGSESTRLRRVVYTLPKHSDYVTFGRGQNGRGIDNGRSPPACTLYRPNVTDHTSSHERPWSLPKPLRSRNLRRDSGTSATIPPSPLFSTLRAKLRISSRGS